MVFWVVCRMLPSRCCVLRGQRVGEDLHGALEHAALRGLLALEQEVRELPRRGELAEVAPLLAYAEFC